MDLTRDYIDGLSFTVKKDKYYMGNEVDEALDNIAAGVDDLHRQLGEYRLREDKMKNIIIRYQTAEKQHQAMAQNFSDLQARANASALQNQQLQAQLAASEEQCRELEAKVHELEDNPSGTVAPASQAIDPEQLRLAAQAERSLAEYRATRENLIAELTGLQTKRDSLQREIEQIAAEAAERIRALAKN
jgi:chromosome segregation ATPase